MHCKSKIILAVILMKRRLQFSSVILSTLLLAACPHDLAPLPADNEILLVNQTGKTIYYAAYEQGILALINWAPISREENRINAGAAKAVEFAEIYAFAPGKNFVLYWWTNDRNKVAHLSTMVVTPEKLNSAGRRLVLTGFTN